MADRRALVDELVLARSMTVAALPVDDREPDATSRLWAVGIVKVLVDAARERELTAKRDALVLAGAHILGWIEAVDDALGG